MADIESLLAQIRRYEPARRLHASIVVRIESEQRRLSRVRSWYFAGASVLSLSAFIFVLGNTISSLSHSEFLNYVSLIFSDTDIVLSSWKEFSLALVESLPFVAILAGLVTVFAFLWSLAHAAKNITRVLSLSPKIS